MYFSASSRGRAVVHQAADCCCGDAGGNRKISRHMPLQSAVCLSGALNHCD